MKKYIKELDRLFSIYIRLRDADGVGIVKCCTCPAYHHFKRMQSGHFIPKHNHRAIRWEPLNAAGQCVKCNMFSEGEQVNFETYIVNKHGKQTVENLQIRKRNLLKLNKGLAEIMIKELKTKIKALPNYHLIEHDKSYPV